MTGRTDRSERITYGYIGLINLCVGIMFAVVLWPAPDPSPVMAAHVVRPSPTAEAAVEVRPIVGSAHRVTVPGVGIDVSVRSGSYDADTRSWVVDDESAFHADTTVPVNNTNGTSLIYGHAKWPIFVSLPKVQPGATAYVYTNEGYRFEYVFESKREVSPNDVSMLVSTGPPTLLLQTCSGPLDSYRTLVAFRLNGVMHDES